MATNRHIRLVRSSAACIDNDDESKKKSLMLDRTVKRSDPEKIGLKIN